MRKIIFSALLLASLTGCQSDDPATTNNNPVAVDFALVGRENLYGNGSEQISESNLVINDTPAWQALLDQMTTANTLPLDFGNTDIDFSQWTVVAVFDQVQMSGGYAIDVVSIESDNTSVIVDVEKSNGGEGAEATVITQPYHIVKMPKTNLPVTFE